MLIFTSCQENDIATNNEIVQGNNLIPSISSANYNIQPCDFGVIHNQILDYVTLQSYDTNLSNVDVANIINNNIDNFLTINYGNISESTNNFIFNNNSFSVHNLEYLNEHISISFLKEKLFESLNNLSTNALNEATGSINFSQREKDFIITSFNNIFEQNFSEMTHNQVFNAIKTSANYNISAYYNISWNNGEGYIAMAFLSVASHSAEYWEKVWRDVIIVKYPETETDIEPVGVAPFVTADAVGAGISIVVDLLEGEKNTSKIAKNALKNAGWSSVGGAICAGISGGAKSVAKFLGLFK